MDWYWLIISGLFGGLVGGMGMGGGTLLIPILTIFLGFQQHLSQAINLLVFIPTAIISIIIHAKNKLIDYKAFFWLVIPAVVASVVFAFLANNIDNSMLKIIFAVFLICIGIFELIIAIKQSYKKRNNFTDKIGI